MQKPNKNRVAATLDNARTYVFAPGKIRDREVGGSNPLAPTIYFQALTAVGIGGRFCFVAAYQEIHRFSAIFIYSDSLGTRLSSLHQVAANDSRIASQLFSALSAGLPKGLCGLSLADVDKYK